MTELPLQGYTHATMQEGWFIAYALCACDVCNRTCVAPNQLKFTGPTVLQVFSILIEQPMPPEISHCEALGVAVCPSCYQGD